MLINTVCAFHMKRRRLFRNYEVMKKKKHTQSGANQFAPTAAMGLLQKLHTKGSRHALTPRESSIATMNGALESCRGLVGMVATTGTLLQQANISEVGKDDVALLRAANALNKDLKSFNENLKVIEQNAKAVTEIKEDLDFLPEALKVCQELTEWQDNFRSVVLPLNGQVHDRCVELVEEKQGDV